jgi:hypothetical protein
MGFSVFDVCRFALLLLNAMAILSERRFLARYGIVPPGAAQLSGAAAGGDALFGGASIGGGFDAGDGSVSMKHQIGQLLFSVRLLLRWPLMIANVVMVVLTVVFA